MMNPQMRMEMELEMCIPSPIIYVISGIQKNKITLMVFTPLFRSSSHFSRNDERTLVAMPIAKEFTKKEQKYHKSDNTITPFTTLICNSTTVRNTRIATTSESTVSPSRMAMIWSQQPQL